MKIIVVPTIEPRRRQVATHIPIELDLLQFPSWSEEDLEKYGQIWARVWPTDIVMLVGQ